MEVNGSVIEGLLARLSLACEHLTDGDTEAASVPYTLAQLLDIAVEHRATLLHINVGSPPTLRINNQLTAIGETSLSRADCRKLLAPVLTPEVKRAVYSGSEVELCFPAARTGFRVNAFLERGSLGASIRRIRSDIPKMSSLGLAGSVAEQVLAESAGLILLTGQPRCGKINTLASLVSHINSTRAARIITLEQPIQFWHCNNHSTVLQREVGLDTESFSQGVQQAVYQDPDVLALSELPDRETAESALRAAASGHLVLAILDASSPVRALERLLDTFSEQDSQYVTMLANSLRVVLHQTLVHRSDGRGVIPAFEILVNTEEVRRELRQNQIDKLNWLMQNSGMQTLSKSLTRLVEAGVVTREEALSHVSAPEDLQATPASETESQDSPNAAQVDENETPLMSWL